MGVLYSKADDPGLDAAIGDYGELCGKSTAAREHMPTNLIEVLVRPIDAADIDLDKAIGERHGPTTRKPVDFATDSL